MNELINQVRITRNGMKNETYLSADFARLGEEAQFVLNAGVDISYISMP